MRAQHLPPRDQRHGRRRSAPPCRAAAPFASAASRRNSLRPVRATSNGADARAVHGEHALQPRGRPLPAPRRARRPGPRAAAPPRPPRPRRTSPPARPRPAGPPAAGSPRSPWTPPAPRRPRSTAAATHPARRRSVRSVCAPTHSRTSAVPVQHGDGAHPHVAVLAVVAAQAVLGLVQRAGPHGLLPRPPHPRAVVGVHAVQPAPAAAPRPNGWPVKRVHPGCSVTSTPLRRRRPDELRGGGHERAEALLALAHGRLHLARARSSAFTVATSSRGSTGCVR